MFSCSLNPRIKLCTQENVTNSKRFCCFGGRTYILACTRPSQKGQYRAIELNVFQRIWVWLHHSSVENYLKGKPVKIVDQEAVDLSKIPQVASIFTNESSLPYIRYNQRDQLIRFEKTEIANLKYNRINPFLISFEDRGAEEQAEEIYDYLNTLAKTGDAKIAITYSANNDQAQDIYEKYETGETPQISGGNQALVFNRLLAKVANADWKDRFHVLPIPTCLHAGGAQPSSNEQLDKAMRNIATHLSNGYIVLGLQNQLSNIDRPIAVGGGVASRVFNGEKEAFVMNSIKNMMAGNIPFSN